MSIKNDGHYFCRAGGNRPDGLNEPVTQELLEGYFHLISKEYENQHFSMYGFIMNETLYIKGCVFNELNGDMIHIPLNKDYREIARLIKCKVISQKKYLFAVVRNRT
ncbi:TPA: hypothetical protein ACGQEE_004874 [Escherichia coli]